jgi:iron complex outermembrane receptor protein
MFNRRLIGTITHYNMDYKDIQLSVQGISPTSGNTISSTFNAGGAKINGFEVELQALIAGSLRFSFNGDFTNSHYTQFDDKSVPGGTRVNEPLTFIPDYRVSGALENRFSLGGDMAVTPRVQVTRTGQRDLITDISPVVREVGHVPAYTVVDASLRFDLNKTMSVEFYGKNLFNKQYMDDALAVGFVVLTYYAAPVSYGATLRLKF